MNIQQFDMFVSELLNNNDLINLSNEIHKLRIFILEHLDDYIRDFFKIECDIEDFIDEVISKLLSSKFSENISFINEPLNNFIIKGKFDDLLRKLRSINSPKGSELRKLWWFSENFSGIIDLRLLLSKIFILLKHCRMRDCFIYPEDFGFGIDININDRSILLIFNLIIKSSLCRSEDSLIPFFEIKIKDYLKEMDIKKGISDLSNAKSRIKGLLNKVLIKLKV